MIEAADQRIVRGLPATLLLAPTDQEGEPLAVTGPVDVTVTGWDGAEVLTGTAAESDGTWSLAVAAGDVPVLDQWTAVWVDTGTGATWTTVVDVTGGHTVTVARILASDATLNTHPAASAIAARLVAEVEAEWICDLAFTPRLRTFTVDGDGTCDLRLPFHACRRLRAVSVNGAPLDVGALAPVTAGQVVVRQAGWAAGRANVTGAVEVGLDAPPPDLARALLTRIRTLMMAPDSHVPLTAIQWAPDDKGVYKLDRASRYRCGIPDVDAVYFRYSKRASAGDDATPAPASASLDFNPSAHSLFHGGPR